MFAVSLVANLDDGWLGQSEAVPQEDQPLGHRFVMPQPPSLAPGRKSPFTFPDKLERATRITIVPAGSSLHLGSDNQ